tara:strand:- start:6 stop:356 length:351 start_codon:yes stop_codon:yes gene_type:complete
MDKQVLVNHVKKWIEFDNKIKASQKIQQQLKKEKKMITDSLVEIMREEEIDSLNVNGGNINYVKRDVKKPITKKYLLDVLSQYYSGDIEKVNNLNSFIMDNRETVTRESIEHIKHK